MKQNHVPTVNPTSNVLITPKCQAKYFWENKNKIWCKVRPYNTSNPNEIVFADGSKLQFTVPGQPPVVVPPPNSILLQAVCEKAFDKGVSDRLGRRCFNSNFRKQSRKHIPRVKLSYAKGFFSPPPWPRYVNSSRSK